MGGLQSHSPGIPQSVFQKPSMSVLLVGLKGAGKTTILKQLRIGHIETNTPTGSSTVETIVYRNIAFHAWDLGDETPPSSVWKMALHNVKCIIFVVDSSNIETLHKAKEELLKILPDHPKEAILLVFCNKQDLTTASDANHVVDTLGLRNLRDRQWNAQTSNASTGQGIFEGFEWLMHQAERL